MLLLPPVVYVTRHNMGIIH